VEVLLGLIGALLGAFAVVAAQFVSALSSRKLEEQKQRRMDVARATRSLLEALQAQQWLVWKAVFDAEEMSETDLDEYNKTMRTSLGSITADLGVLSASCPDAYGPYEPLARRVFVFDQEIAESVVDFRRDSALGIERMRRCAKLILPYHWYAYRQVMNVVEGKPVNYNYEPEDWDPQRPFERGAGSAGPPHADP
jgi:hypothetical protein